MVTGTNDSVTETARPAVRATRKAPSGAAGEVRCYGRRDSGMHAIRLEEAIAEFRELRKSGESRQRLWIDVVSPGAAEEKLLRDQLNLHQLAVEDSMRGRQRPKLDRYPGFYFLVAYVASVDPERDRTALDELHVFVGTGWIVTVHDRKLRMITEAIARWRTDEGAFPTTASLAHALLDGIVDSYMPVIDHLGGEVDELENRILSDDPRDPMPRLLELRREIAGTRRVLSPLHEIIRVLLRRDAVVLEDPLEPYFQDILDHLNRETEELDALRDTLAASLQAYYSVSTSKLNQTLRIMASWSIILMAMAWLAGVYGMNFVHMPELRWPLGYLWALALMFGVGAVLGVVFRRRGWL